MEVWNSDPAQVVDMMAASSGDAVAGETSWIARRIVGCLCGEEHSDSLA